jgi:hypothetical protein
MASHRLSNPLRFLCLGVAVISGCATQVTPPPLPTQADVRVGPEIELLAFKTTYGDLVRAVPDAEGRVHVLIAADELRVVYHVVVEANGVVRRTAVQSDVSPRSIDAAFDEHGRLHALVGDKHLYLDNATWVQSDPTPWAKAGLEIEQSSLFSEERGPRFVRGASRLIWAFEVDGGKVGANWRVDWYDPYTILPIPWIARGEKTVLVAESNGAETWTVLEREDKHDTIASCLASDQEGDVYVVYEKRRVILQGAGNAFFLRIGAQELIGAEPQAAGSSLHREGRLLLRSTPAGRDLVFDVVKAFGGSGWNYEAPLMLAQEDCLAVDPGDQNVLLGGRMLFQSGQWSAASQFPVFSRRHYRWRASAAGDGRYHGVAIYKYFGPGLFPPLEFQIVYGRLIGTTWETAELGHPTREAFDIASFGPEKAFVLWETDKGIVGHWVEIAARKE